MSACTRGEGVRVGVATSVAVLPARERDGAGALRESGWWEGGGN